MDGDDRLEAGYRIRPENHFFMTLRPDGVEDSQYWLLVVNDTILSPIGALLVGP